MEASALAVVHELSVDDVGLLGRIRRRLGRALSGAGFGDRPTGRGDRLLGALYAFFVVASQRVPGIVERLLDRPSLVFRELGALLRQPALDGVKQRVGLIAKLDLLSPLCVLGGMGLGLLYHPLDVLLVQARRWGDDDLLLLAVGLIF